MTVNSKDAAAHLCRNAGWRLSNLEIQKVLYMADMNFVGQGHGRLINENFEAWDYGPVLPSLYHKLKVFGSKPVKDVFWGVEDISGTPEASIIERALSGLKGLSPGQLVENTHWSGGAWAKRYVPGARGQQILAQDMINEYQNRRAG